MDLYSRWLKEVIPPNKNSISIKLVAAEANILTFSPLYDPKKLAL